MKAEEQKDAAVSDREEMESQIEKYKKAIEEMTENQRDLESQLKKCKRERKAVATIWNLNLRSVKVNAKN